MEVRAPRGDQAVVPAELQVARRLDRRVLAVVALEPHQARGDQLRDHLVAVRETGMGEDGNARGLADEPHGVLGREPLPGHVARLARGQVPVEGLAHGLDVAALHHGLRDVRPARRAFADEGEDLVRIDGHSQLAEPRRHAVDALAPLFPLGAAEVLEPCGLVVDVVTEDVDLGALDVAVDVDARNDRERGVAGRLVQRLRQAARGVVVGDGEHPEPPVRGLLHQFPGREAAVGCRRVGVEVYRARHAPTCRVPTPGRRAPPDG